MEAIKSTAGWAATNLTKPTFYKAQCWNQSCYTYYKTQFNDFSKYYYWKYIRPGSCKPLAHLMILTGVIGYSVEWFGLGRNHVAHKNAIIEKALKEHGGHH